MPNYFALANLVPSTYNFVQGIKQTRQGKDMAENLVDPVMPIPQSATEALNLARLQASSRFLSGQTALQNQLDQNNANATADVLRGGTSSSDVLGALTNLNASGQANQNNLAFQAAQDYQNRQMNVQNQLGIMSEWESKKWENDVLSRFLRDAAAASALRNAGLMNTQSGLQGFADTAVAFGGGGGVMPKTTENASGGNTGMASPYGGMNGAMAGFQGGGTGNMFGSGGIDTLDPSMLQGLTSSFPLIV